MSTHLRLHVALTLLTLTVGASGVTNAQHLRIYYPDIEQGSSTLVVSPSGKALLVDGGTGIKGVEDGVEDFINDLIDAGVVTSVDFTLATHYDEDHIGRMENVYQYVALPPTLIAYDRGEDGGVPSTFAYSDYEFGAEQFTRTTITPNTTIDLGSGVTVRCYVVNAELPDTTSVDLTGTVQQENARSVGVVVSYGDFDLWLGGDLTGNAAKNVAEVEQAVAPFVGDVDVYTFNHHGSETSSTSTFLSTLKAELGIVQISASNTFGHPRIPVVTAFKATPDTGGLLPLYTQQNPGDPDDTRSDDSLADGIADCDDTTGPFGLPGTFAIYSDGTSYRIHACNIPATALSADTGVGTIGDYPPAISRVLRTPQVPLASESVTVEADVEDLDGGSTVELRYDLDGVAQTPISMTLQTGITYSASIPAQTDGTLVEFRVAATDGAVQTELSPRQGYYSGTTSIATVRSNDADGVLIPKGYGARLRGNMTAEDGVFHDFVTLAYVQDATGGIQVFDSTLLGLSRGDDVEFVGYLEQFGGQTELNIAEKFGNVGHDFIAMGTAPAPLVQTVAQVGEAVEGQLIRINNVTVVSGTIPESGSDNLTISDDGGTTTLTLRIDGETDVPGSNTPTQPFDIIGIASQFDSWVPLDSGYQTTPREKLDFISDEVNHPVVLISEIHADPANGPQGDANGDGSRDAAEDEFVEIVNTGFTSVDVSGWTISDGVGVRHVFPAGSVIPGREAAVVFGGGTPTGDFGNAMANGLVFTASTGTLDLDNTADTVTLADDTPQDVQSVTYGSEANSNESIVRDPDYSNAPFVQHTGATGSGGSRYSPGTRISGQAFTVAQGSLILTEVLYDATSSDDQLEWFELYNTTGAPIALGDLCVGAGGGDYTHTLVSLSGTVAADATFVVGGPLSTSDNSNPTLDLAVDFSPDFQNTDATTADGVALFNLRCSQVTPSSVPIDAVVYGPANPDNLIDETGVANPPDVGDAPSGQSIERIDLPGTWQIQAVPNPNVAFPPPPPEGLLLSEVFYRGSGSDDGWEWVELYNSGAQAIELSSFSLGNGGPSYASSKVQLSGTVQPGDTFVVGGPTSGPTNGNPTYDQAIDFDPDFQNAGSTADGVALFNVPAAAITGSTVPIDAVVYGTSNDNNLIDETGSANPPEVGNSADDESIERVDLAGTWQVQSTPNPGTTPLAGGDTTPPADPTGLSATGGDATVSLDWDDNGEGDLDGYNVFRSTTAGGPHSQINGSLVTVSDYTDNTVTNGTTYYYVVTAVDTSANESGASNEASATPQSGGGPTTMSVSAIDLSVGNGGNKRGIANVTILDDLGNPVAGVTVTGTFTGDYSETRSNTTDSNGVAKIQTQSREKLPISFTFCVDDVTGGSLTYDSGANVETCDSGSF